VRRNDGQQAVERRSAKASPAARLPFAHEQAEEEVAHLIAVQKLAAGARLPPERELAEQLGVSRMTLRRALASLERRGLIVRRAGRGGGTFVAEPKVDRELGDLIGVPEMLRRQGVTAGTRLISATLRPAGEAAADALGIPADALVYDVWRIRLANGVPLSLERARLPAELFPDLLERPLSGSIYQLLASDYGTVPARALERLESVLAEREAAAALEVAEGAALMSVERITYDEHGAPFEFGNDLFRGDRTRVVVVRAQDGTTSLMREDIAAGVRV
jgi:GntR family transcriptional regulator